MNKVFHLSTCSTCVRILKSTDLPEEAKLQNVKEQHIAPDELDWLKEQTGSYEGLLNRRSVQYRKLGLHEKELSEQDYRQYILQEYALLKRPIFAFEDAVFVGNSKKTLEDLAVYLVVP